MSFEKGDFSPIKQPETADSAAFRIEYNRFTPPASIKKDIDSYIGEYYLGISRYDYILKYKDGGLRDEHKGELMTDMAKRAIDRRYVEGENTLRENQELLGLERLQELVKNAPMGSHIIYGSPPGEVSDGYSPEYGFVYSGLIENGESNTKNLLMQAIRVNKPNLEEYNRAFSQLTGEEWHFENAEDFLSRPFMVDQTKDMEWILHENFTIDDPEEKQKQFKLIRQQLAPYTDEFIHLVQHGASHEILITYFHSIENLTAELLRNNIQNKTESSDVVIYSSLPEKLSQEVFMGRYGFTPEQIPGSCGSNGPDKNAFTSANMFNKFSSLSDLLVNPAIDYKKDANLCRCGNQEPHFHCPGKKIEKNGEKHPCNAAIPVGYGITKCPQCGEGKKC